MALYPAGPFRGHKHIYRAVIRSSFFLLLSRNISTSEFFLKNREKEAAALPVLVLASKVPLHDALQIHKDGLKDLVVQGLLLRRGVRKQAQKGCELQVSPSLCPVHMQRHLAALSTTQACCSHREDVLQTSSGDFF